MGRRSVREARRAEISWAFARVLAARGRGGATMAAVAEEARIAPGLLHHHFADKQDLYAALLELLMGTFRRRLDGATGEPLDAYVDAALGLDERSDITAARAWVGLFSEALGDPVLYAKVRRMLDGEVAHVERRSRGALSSAEASAVVAFIVGALVFGAFAPRKAAGFAAPTLRRLIRAFAR
jgi:TetR/AcrR family transcriptional regulator, transcriptional repressor of bet genes